MQGKTFDVGKFIDDQRIGATQLLVLVLCAVVMICDGYDVFVMGFVLQPIAADFKVSPAAITPVFVIQNLGLALGTVLIGPFADRFGRRWIMIGSAASFGLLTLAVTRASSVDELIALRFVAGLCFGCLIPNAIAITSEFAPARFRATLVTWMFIGYVAGAGSGGVVAVFLVKNYGWQSAFWVGGLAPISVAVLLLFFLPESIRYRVLKHGGDRRILDVLRRMDASLELTGDERLVLNEPKVTGSPISALFQDGRMWTTVLLWLGFFIESDGDFDLRRIPPDVSIQFRRTEPGTCGGYRLILFPKRNCRVVFLWPPHRCVWTRADSDVDISCGDHCNLCVGRHRSQIVLDIRCGVQHRGQRHCSASRLECAWRDGLSDADACNRCGLGIRRRPRGRDDRSGLWRHGARR